MTNSSKLAKTYAYTNEAYRRMGWYKIGGTTKDNAIDRIEEQDSTDTAAPLEKVFESQKAKGLWDDQLRAYLAKTYGWVYTRHDKSREWMKAPEGASILTDGVVKNTLSKAVNAITQTKAGLKKYSPTPTQAKALDDVMEQFRDLIKGEEPIHSVADLCARFGKTLWVLELFNRLNKEFGYGTLLLPAFWLSAHSSFEKEISEFSDFNHFVFIDTSKPGWEAKLKETKINNKIAVISLSLCGEASDQRLKRFDPIRELSDVFLFCDEADVGAHTERSAKIIDYVTVE